MNEELNKKASAEFAKIDWDKNDISIREVLCWGENERNKGGFIVRWSKPHCGFGELTFSVKNGKLHCDTECMSRRFVSQVLEKLAEEVVMD